MTVPQRISLVTLGVADVARSTAFYESLGWRRSSASVPSTTFFNTVGPVLTLFGHDDLAADAGLPAGGEAKGGDAEGGAGGREFRGVTLAINLESREAVDATYAEWVAAGATEVKAPEAMFWGGYSSYVADLDGHLWELAHNPGFTLDADGRLRAPD
jgi:catechol 2,3-dioxygenase-like lactoylglutathione lyase family enzyme